MTEANWIVVIVGTWVAGALFTAWSLMDGTGLGERPPDIADVVLIAFGPITLAFWTTMFLAVKLGLVDLDRLRR
jgi:hypothetical protein